MIRVRVLVLHAPGTNRDREAALACQLAGAEPVIVPVSTLAAQPHQLETCQMLVLPGGFSYGDDLGAGKVWSLDLRFRLIEVLTRFHERRRPMLGICNGFQALVKSGFLPGGLGGGLRQPVGNRDDGAAQTATLTRNASTHFECRWVHLRPNNASHCVFTHNLHDLIDCPVAHGEGRFLLADPNDLPALQAAGQVALTYVDAAGESAGGAYPTNPNGSLADIAGVCDPTGTILGLMPHPEDHLWAAQHPLAGRGHQGRFGLALFASGIRYAAQL